MLSADTIPAPSMFLLVLGLVLAVVPPDSTDDPCSEHLPVQSRSELSVGSIPDAQTYWTTESGPPPDSLRAHIAQLRRTRTCLRERSSPEIETPSSSLIQSLHWEGILHAALQEFPEAFEAFEAAVAHANTGSPSDSAGTLRAKWVPTLHQDRGYLHYLLGDLSASIQHYLKAYEATPRSQPGERITFLIDLGILNQRVQDYRSARHYFRRAERRLRLSSDSTASHAQVQARLYHQQADLLQEQTLNAEFARDSLERVSRLARRGRSLVDSGTERHARTSLLLSESLGYLGAYDQAYRLNEEARAYFRANDDIRLQTIALLKLGVLHVQTERWSRADSVLGDALTQAQALGDLDYQRRILRTLGRLHEMRGNWATAETHYRTGVSVIEEYRESLTASQWSMTAFAQWRDVYRGLVRALLAQDRPREAFTVLDRSRARHLQDLRTQARVAKQLPSEGRARLDSLSRALTTVRNQLGTTALSADRATELRNREVQLMASRQQLLRLDPQAVASPSLDTISAALRRQDRALVTYFVDDPWPVYDRSPRSTAFILTPDTLRTEPLPAVTKDSVSALVQSTSSLFRSRGEPERVNAMHFDLRPLHTLHGLVYAPVAEHLSPSRPLTVVPDGPLFHLPFSMLVESMPGGRYAPSKARFVLHNRPTSLVLAPSLIVDTSQSPSDWSTFDPQLAAYGVSDFDTLDTVPRALRSALPEAVRESPIRLPSLPGVQRELDAITNSVPDARATLDGEASERSFRRDARRAGVLHVASHAFVNASSPLQSAILLRSDAGAPGASRTAGDTSGSDGILFLHELQDQQTRIPLVVLSGCNTARGPLRGGEGMEGLQYAFRALGARSTLSTLWSVADDANADLMTSFYEHLQSGLSKDRALRRARLDYLEAHPDRASPFFWAAPVLYGSPAPAPLESASVLPVGGPWLWVGLVVLAALGLVLVLLWRGRDRLPEPFCNIGRPA